MMCAYPSSPGVVGQYILFKPNFFAAEPVVSPMQAMELFQLSTFGISFNQALLQMVTKKGLNNVTTHKSKP